MMKNSIINNQLNFSSCLKVALTFCFLSISSLSMADTVVVPIGQQGKSIEAPKTGKSMQQVESEFGQPAQKLGTIGEPPITRWRYANFTVYFEYDKVIHAVIHAK
jgi:hypothetical protein